MEALKNAFERISAQIAMRAKENNGFSIEDSSRYSLELYLELEKLYDEFGECLAWLECARNQTVLLNYDYQPGVAYYVRIVGAEGTAYGAYTCGWCDGIHHCLTEEERILEASCIAEGGSGRVCTICSAILGGKITPKTDHKYGQWRETVEPTKEAEGVEICVCTFCGDVEMRSIPQKTSLFDRWFR